jgi:hypothetical protein
MVTSAASLPGGCRRITRVLETNEPKAATSTMRRPRSDDWGNYETQVAAQAVAVVIMCSRARRFAIREVYAMGAERAIAIRLNRAGRPEQGLNRQ